MLKIQNVFSVRKLTVAAMLTALGVVLKFCEFPLGGNFLLVSFVALPTALAGMLLGPAYAAGVGITADILGFFIAPKGNMFFPGFTLTAALVGLTCGLLLYNRPLSLWRLILCVLIITVPLNSFLNTYWLYVMKFVPYVVAIFPRAAKELILAPIYFGVMYTIQKYAAPVLAKIIYRQQ